MKVVIELPEFTEFAAGECVYKLHITPSYFGASYVNTIPREGENWLRGGDLLDGPLDKFPDVLADIVCHALGTGRWKRYSQP